MEFTIKFHTGCIVMVLLFPCRALYILYVQARGYAEVEGTIVMCIVSM